MLRSFVSYQSMFFCDAFASANIWLYHVLHDNLHCLVFKEHPWFSLEAFEKLFRESASIWYLSAFALSRRNFKSALCALALRDDLAICRRQIASFLCEATSLHWFHRCLRCCALAVCRRLALYYTLLAAMSTLFWKSFSIFSMYTKAATRMRDGWFFMVAAQRFELRTLRVWTACSSQLSYAAGGGQGWIRTIVIRRWQIYSLFPLTTRAPTHIYI